MAVGPRVVRRWWFQVIVASIVVIGGALFVDIYTEYGLLVPFTALSGLGAVVMIILHLSHDPPDINQLVEEIESEEGDQIEPETLQMVDVLTHELGREAYAILSDEPRQFTVGELTQEIAADRNNVTPEEVNSEQYQSVFEQLFGSVLVEMDQLGIVDFERERGLVDLTEGGERLAELLGLSQQPEQQNHSTAELGLTQNILFDILSNRRRRFVIEELSEMGEVMDLSELSERIARHETGQQSGDLDSDDIKRRYTSIYRTHLPKLDDVDIVDYDVDGRTVQITPVGTSAVDVMRQFNHEIANSLSVPVDAAYEIASNPRRRAVLRYLRESEDIAQLDSLAEFLAADEENINKSEVSGSLKKRMYISLFQTHIPKMADEGIVNYDTDSGEVSLTQAGRKFAEILANRNLFEA